MSKVKKRKLVIRSNRLESEKQKKENRTAFVHSKTHNGALRLKEENIKKTERGMKGMAAKYERHLL